MKTKCLLIITIALLGGAVFIFSGCKKYEDGPAISLVPKKARITNNWKLEELSINGVSQIFTDLRFREIKDDGTFTSTNALTANDSGTWEFTSKKDSITFISDVYNDYTRKILKLKSNELWLIYDVNYDTYEYHYVEF